MNVLHLLSLEMYKNLKEKNENKKFCKSWKCKCENETFQYFEIMKINEK